MARSVDQQKIDVLRGMVMHFATALYNETDYHRNTIVSTLQMGEQRYDYVIPEDELPAKLTDRMVGDALDGIFERAGWK